MATFLVEPREIRQRMFLPDVDGVNRAIRQALEGTTQFLESQLRTTLDFRADVVDQFYVQDSDLVGGRFSERFLLTRGLVTEAGFRLEARTSPRNIGFIEGTFTDLRDPAANAVVTDPDEFVAVQAKQGVVVVQDFRLFRLYLRVRYDAGIHADRDKPDKFLQADKTISAASPGNVTFDAGAGTITRATGNWSDDDFAAGDRLVIGGTASNDGAVVADQIAGQVVTVGANDVLVDEVAAAATVQSFLQGVPAWLKELATVYAQWALTTTPTLGQAMGDDNANVQRANAQLLARTLETLLDEHTRYEPDANKAI